MTILIAGGTGYLGGALARSLLAQGHTVRVLTRRPTRPDQIGWPPDHRTGDLAAVIDQADAVVNLAGASIAGARWTARHKAALRESRVRATSLLAEAIAASPRPPVFISGSAIGIYGPRGDDPVTEDTAAGTDFLARLATEWERTALGAAHATRVVLLRTGLVLSKDGGALPQLALPFRFFAGGAVGSGRQYVSWIHRDDWVSMVEWAIETDAVSGPLNVTAPAPVTNADLATALGGALHRPSFLRAPAFAVRLAVGEMADPAILSGQRVLPAKAQRLGFAFRYPAIDAALAGIYGRH